MTIDDAIVRKAVRSVMEFARNAGDDLGPELSFNLGIVCGAAMNASYSKEPDHVSQNVCQVPWKDGPATTSGTQADPA